MSNSSGKGRKTGVESPSSAPSPEPAKPRQFWLRFAETTIALPLIHHRGRVGVPLLVGPFPASLSAYNWGRWLQQAVRPDAIVLIHKWDARWDPPGGEDQKRSYDQELQFTVHEGDYLSALGGENPVPWQPCDDYKPHESSYDEMYNAHQCMRCEVGTVRFCHNCMADHHDIPNGWNRCSGQK